MTKTGVPRKSDKKRKRKKGNWMVRSISLGAKHGEGGNTREVTRTPGSFSLN